MATKTITLELDAYEKLRRAKRPGESFSAVVRRTEFTEHGTTGRKILEALKRQPFTFSEEELDRMDEAQQLDFPPDDSWAER